MEKVNEIQTMVGSTIDCQAIKIDFTRWKNGIKFDF